MLAMPDRRTEASAGHRTTQAAAGRLTFHMSVTPGMSVPLPRRFDARNLRPKFGQQKTLENIMFSRI
jgi:hypothetical protein